ncbi:hypothetical protein MIR68_000053 [Amoeboaphelidium protococcarum]|nr:hypothetical protein MIR68_000053 [Amoeboaphelidium protococcarum]
MSSVHIPGSHLCMLLTKTSCIQGYDQKNFRDAGTCAGEMAGTTANGPI